MSLEALAYDDDSPALLVLDRTALSAYDARSDAPLWEAPFEDSLGPLAAVAFAHPEALPALGGNAPWRDAAQQVALVVDALGGMHSVGLTRGDRLGSVGPYGAPQAFASSTHHRVVALAVAGRIHLWEAGAPRELLVDRVSALAFSRDGRTLAIGTELGEVLVATLDGTRAPPASIARGLGRANAIAAHPDGAWLVVTEAGGYDLRDRQVTRLAVGLDARRISFEQNGHAISVQNGDRALSVFLWPQMQQLLRIEYSDRPIRGLSFGPQGSLATALDHGDANKIDIRTSVARRTETFAGRPHRPVVFDMQGVYGQRRTISPGADHSIRLVPKANGPRGSSYLAGGGIVFGVLFVAGVRVFGAAAMATSTTTPYSYPYRDLAPRPTSDRGPDRIPEAYDPEDEEPTQVALVRISKAGVHATEVITEASDRETPEAIVVRRDGAFLVSTRTEQSNVVVRRRTAGGAWTKTPMLAPRLELGGRADAWMLADDDSGIKTVLHRSGDGDWAPRNPSSAEAPPRALWATANGREVFVSAGKAIFHSKDAGKTWDDDPTARVTIALWGRSNKDVFALTDNGVIEHFDGIEWDVVDAVSGARCLSGTSTELLVLAASTDD